MTERDIKMAVYRECAELADAVSRRYGNLPAYGAGRVATEIRELMQRTADEPEPSPVVVGSEPYL